MPMQMFKRIEYAWLNVILILSWFKSQFSIGQEPIKDDACAFTSTCLLVDFTFTIKMLP